MSDQVTITMTRRGQGVGHAATADKLRPICGANMNAVFSNPVIQARSWEAVGCKRCLATIGA